ncbi:MAG: TIGR02710 family CRISPR-associated protein, partial [Planctomycetes bacterium]|nr:TIGR02710 family CRISPR-associated protein [Planctomycetota bacterium]
RCSYVGGSQRTKDGTGTVVSGAESVVHAVNPWDALGFQAVDDFMALFDQGAYAPAATRMDHTLRMVDDKTRKRELASLKKLAELYDAWDRFDHRAALNKLRDTLQSANDLRAALRDVVLFDRVFGMLKNHEEVLGPLADSRGGGLVRDLLSNARRRDNESRWDDGTARLYRAIEAMAQDKLREQHGIDNTKKIPLERVPSPLREEWQSRARDNAVMVGLQDAYLLLKQLGDPLGEQFFASGLADREGSPLTSRNDSILAHGFTPISAKSFEALWRHALQLAGCTEHDLCQFPKLTTQ